MKQTSILLLAFAFGLCACANQSTASSSQAQSAQSGEPQGSDAAIIQNTEKSLVLQALQNQDSLETVLEELEDDDIITEDGLQEGSEIGQQFNLTDSAEIYSSLSENVDTNKTFTFNQDGEDLTFYLCLQDAKHIPYQKDAYYALLS